MNETMPKRMWIGALTSAIWIGVGLYTVAMSPSNVWKAVGAGEIVIGLARAALWRRDLLRFHDERR